MKSKIELFAKQYGFPKALEAEQSWIDGLGITEIARNMQLPRRTIKSYLLALAKHNMMHQVREHLFKLKQTMKERG